VADIKKKRDSLLMQTKREHKVKMNAKPKRHDIHESMKLQYMQLAELECQALAEEAKIEKRQHQRAQRMDNLGGRDFPWLSNIKPLVPPPPRPPRASLSRARGSRPTLQRSSTEGASTEARQVTARKRPILTSSMRSYSDDTALYSYKNRDYIS